MSLFLKREDFAAITAYARKEAPLEACGLLGGEKRDRDAIVRQVIFLQNTDRSAEHFSMDPREQFAAVREFRSHGWQMLGNFHSHPATPARPSEEDKRLAFDPSLRYLILSLQTEQPVLRAFCIEAGKVSEEEILITEKSVLS